MKTRIKNFFKVLKKAFKQWRSKDPFKESAVIAYYAIFSIPGLLIVIITVSGYFFEKEAVQGQISSQITATMGAETALQIHNIVVRASEIKNTFWATIIGVATILLGATGVFVQFQKSINTIWGVERDTKKSGIVRILKTRLFSFGLIIAIAFLLIISLVISALLSAIGSWLIQLISESMVFLMQLINIAVSFGIMTMLFALMFKFFPDADIKWRHVWQGAIITTLLFELAKFALAFYFGKAEPGSGYGPAGSIILVLLWVSYSSMIVFFGAEFTHAYAEMKDGKIAPDKNGKRLTVTR